MPRAVKTLNRIVDRCPLCKSKGLKELVQGEVKINWVAFVLILLFTWGFGLIFVTLWRYSSTEAFCPDCEEAYPID